MIDLKPPFESLETHNLPSSEDLLFMPQVDGANNACLAWYHDKWGLYASGYREAADILVQAIEQRSASKDALVYPVLFMYRQYLELQIKNLIRQARRLQDIKGDFPKHHRISELWALCYELLSDISPGDSVDELKEIARLIGEFSEVDPSSMAFRYPENQDGSTSLPGISHINLRNVRGVIAKIGIILTGADCQIGEYLQCKLDMASECRNER